MKGTPADMLSVPHFMFSIPEEEARRIAIRGHIFSELNGVDFAREEEFQANLMSTLSKFAVLVTTGRSRKTYYDSVGNYILVDTHLSADGGVGVYKPDLTVYSCNASNQLPPPDPKYIAYMIELQLGNFDVEP